MRRRTQGNVSLAIGGLVTGYGLLTLLRDTSTRRQAKKIAKDKAKEKVDKPTTLMKFEVTDKCPCGKKVEKWERQGTPFWNAEEGTWYRRCEACDRDRVCFDAPARIIPIQTKGQEETT